MACHIATTTVDSRNAFAQSLFWSAVLGFAEDADDPNKPEHEECLIQSPDGTQRILFIDVPEAKQIKNRIHFDLEPTDVTRDQELQRLFDLGATQVDDRRLPDGRGWVVLSDPEGNEFCILRSAAERAAQP
jgi:catechol 2,3-dioxygenase-like lactoylglutathione lyase family enzyme